MKKNLTELVFILDRSGSMQGLEGDTIGGFNAMIEKQKKEPGEAFVSTVLFDDRAEVLHDRMKVSEVQPITEKEYYVRGCTALLDVYKRQGRVQADQISRSASYLCHYGAGEWHGHQDTLRHAGPCVGGYNAGHLYPHHQRHVE